MQSLGGVFGELFATRVGRQPQTGQNRFFSREGTTVDVAQQLPAPSEPAASPESQPLPPAQPATAEGSELASVRKIFHQNGEALELGENRLKATSGRDYVRRLTYLFLYAHELHGRSWTPRSELLTVLKEAKVWDHNSSHWLRAKKGFRVDPDDRLQLIQAGRDEAKKTLAEALDSNVNDEWNPDTRTVQKRGPRKQKSS